MFSSIDFKENDSLKVKSVKLECDGVLRIETNISENLELAKLVSKDKLEHCLNHHFLEMHVYQNDYTISSIKYKGEVKIFTAEQFTQFLEQL